MILEITEQGAGAVTVLSVQPAIIEVVANVSESVVQVQEGLRGPQGPQGVPGAGNSISITATSPIGGNRAVRGDGLGSVAYADSSDVTHIGKCIGITMNAASIGETLEIAISSEITEPSWNWAIGPIYLGVNGLLTQTVPSTGFVQRIGTAVSATRVVVLVHQPILIN